LTAFETMFVLVGYIFDHWDVRSLYGESTATSYRTFRSGEGRWFEVRGRLRDHAYRGGRYEDVIVLEIDRDRFLGRAERYNRLLLPDAKRTQVQD
jgi:hypothetical protein